MIGRIIKDTENIKSYHVIKINTTNIQLKNKIIDVFNNYNWLNIREFVSIPYLNIHDIYDVLLKEIPELNNKTLDLFEF